MRCILLWLLVSTTLAHAQSIPSTQAKNLNGQTVTLPHDLTAPTILLVGFTRKSADQTALWQKQLHLSQPATHVYDVAMLAAVPSALRGLVTHAIRNDVPESFRPETLIVTDHEPEWKIATHFDPAAPDAAYVLVVDHSGKILAQTHEPFTPPALTRLTPRSPGE